MAHEIGATTGTSLLPVKPPSPTGTAHHPLDRALPPSLPARPVTSLPNGHSLPLKPGLALSREPPTSAPSRANAEEPRRETRNGAEVTTVGPSRFHDHDRGVKVEDRVDVVKSEAGSTTASTSRSASRTPVDDEVDHKVKREDETDEQRSPEKPARSKGQSSKRKGKHSTPDSEPQLIGHLPSAEEAAARTYTEMATSTYFSKALGDTPYYDPDNARCDCVYRPGEPLSEQACGEYSGCMNRMLQMECEAGDCRCGGKCQNQRFQKREYAPIEIVKTEKKGFGVRTTVDLAADTFVYEYVGEVIGPAPFARKMKEYAHEGIKHFYFMALDKEVFIDATKKGGKGRFLNHSCNPNCQVAKWTVGKKMRMGIFTKRDIKKDEELTFNYNVDRYGHLAQECFCGEPNCVGFIGGKTQTDIGGMDDLYIDALGIADEVEALGLKGNKKKKGRKLDEDYIPTLGPIVSDEVPKVASAIRQALQTRRILTKLLERVQMTGDDEVQRQLLRLHGLSLMNNILKEYPKDNEILTLDFTILTKWKFQTRNKIETSKIEDEVAKFVGYADDDKVATLARELLATWAELSLGFRIPKAQRDAESDLKRPSHFDIDQLAKRARLEPEAPSSHAADLFERSAFVRPEANVVVAAASAQHRPRKLPPGWSAHRGGGDDPDGGGRGASGGAREYYRNDLSGATQWEVPTKAAEPAPSKPLSAQLFDANALIAEAERAEKAAQELELKRLEEAEREKKREKEERHRRKKEEKEERDKAQKDKRVTGLFSAVVVSTMSKYRSQFEAEAFKKRAKEVTQILLDKEKKRPTYETDVYEALSTEKEAKVKSFVKDWVKKLLQRKKGGRSSSASTSSTPRPSSSSNAGAAKTTSSHSRPSLLHVESSSSSTPKNPGLDMDSPATPHTAPMDVDTPSGVSDKESGDGASRGPSPRRSPPARTP
ncbi:hypothetical protein JCM11491_004163 [Sporobolomyces phaffii]